MLHQLGYWEPSAAAPIEAVTATKPLRLEDQHLRMWSLVLSATFPKEKFEVFDPQCFLRRLLGEAMEKED